MYHGDPRTWEYAVPQPGFQNPSYYQGPPVSIPTVPTTTVYFNGVQPQTPSVPPLAMYNAAKLSPDTLNHSQVKDLFSGYTYNSRPGSAETKKSHAVPITRAETRKSHAVPITPEPAWASKRQTPSPATGQQAPAKRTSLSDINPDNVVEFRSVETNSPKPTKSTSLANIDPSKIVEWTGSPSRPTSNGTSSSSLSNTNIENFVVTEIMVVDNASQTDKADNVDKGSSCRPVFATKSLQAYPIMSDVMINTSETLNDKSSKYHTVLPTKIKNLIEAGTNTDVQQQKSRKTQTIADVGLDLNSNFSEEQTYKELVTRAEKAERMVLDMQFKLCNMDLELVRQSVKEEYQNQVSRVPNCESTKESLKKEYDSILNFIQKEAERVENLYKNWSQLLTEGAELDDLGKLETSIPRKHLLTRLSRLKKRSPSPEKSKSPEKSNSLPEKANCLKTVCIKCGAFNNCSHRKNIKEDPKDSLVNNFNKLEITIKKEKVDSHISQSKVLSVLPPKEKNVNGYLESTPSEKSNRLNGSVISEESVQSCHDPPDDLSSVSLPKQAPVNATPPLPPSVIAKPSPVKSVAPKIDLQSHNLQPQQLVIPSQHLQSQSVITSQQLQPQSVITSEQLQPQSVITSQQLQPQSVITSQQLQPQPVISSQQRTNDESLITPNSLGISSSVQPSMPDLSSLSFGTAGFNPAALLGFGNGSLIPPVHPTDQNYTANLIQQLLTNQLLQQNPLLSLDPTTFQKTLGENLDAFTKQSPPVSAPSAPPSVPNQPGTTIQAPTPATSSSSTTQQRSRTWAAARSRTVSQSGSTDPQMQVANPSGSDTSVDSLSSAHLEPSHQPKRSDPVFEFKAPAPKPDDDAKSRVAASRHARMRQALANRASMNVSKLTDSKLRASKERFASSESLNSTADCEPPHKRMSSGPQLFNCISPQPSDAHHPPILVSPEPVLTSISEGLTGASSKLEDFSRIAPVELKSNTLEPSSLCRKSLHLDLGRKSPHLDIGRKSPHLGLSIKSPHKDLLSPGNSVPDNWDDVSSDGQPSRPTSADGGRYFSGSDKALQETASNKCSNNSAKDKVAINAIQDCQKMDKDAAQRSRNSSTSAPSSSVSTPGSNEPLTGYSTAASTSTPWNNGTAKNSSTSANLFAFNANAWGSHTKALRDSRNDLKSDSVTRLNAWEDHMSGLMTQAKALGESIFAAAGENNSSSVTESKKDDSKPHSPVNITENGVDSSNDKDANTKDVFLPSYCVEKSRFSCLSDTATVKSGSIEELDQINSEAKDRNDDRKDEGAKKKETITDFQYHTNTVAVRPRTPTQEDYSIADAGTWSKVSKKRKPEMKVTMSETLSKTIPGLPPPKPSAKSEKANTNFERLIERICSKNPGTTRSEATSVMSDVRKLNNGTLSGLSMSSIIDSATHYLQLKKAHKSSGSNSRALAPPLISSARAEQKLAPAPAPPPYKLDYDNVRQLNHEVEQDQCAICIDPLSPFPGESKALDCGHRFHEDCIKIWVYEREATCPICRSLALFPEDYPALS